MKFSDKQALIVGGGSGIGLEAGRLLVQAGASVTLVARRQEKLDGAHKTFDTPDNVRTFRCDLTIKEDIDRLITLHLRRDGGCEVPDQRCGCFLSQSLYRPYRRGL